MTPEALIRESARRISEAIDLRTEIPLKAYRLATEAQVLAQTARSLTPSVTSLSKSVGVDVGEYIAYTDSVQSDIEKRMTQRRGA